MTGWDRTCSVPSLLTQQVLFMAPSLPGDHFKRHKYRVVMILTLGTNRRRVPAPDEPPFQVGSWWWIRASRAAGRRRKPGVWPWSCKWRGNILITCTAQNRTDRMPRGDTESSNKSCVYYYIAEVHYGKRCTSQYILLTELTWREEKQKSLQEARKASNAISEISSDKPRYHDVINQDKGTLSSGMTSRSHATHNNCKTRKWPDLRYSITQTINHFTFFWLDPGLWSDLNHIDLIFRYIDVCVVHVTKAKPGKAARANTQKSLLNRITLQTAQ